MEKEKASMTMSNFRGISLFVHQCCLVSFPSFIFIRHPIRHYPQFQVRRENSQPVQCKPSFATYSWHIHLTESKDILNQGARIGVPAVATLLWDGATWKLRKTWKFEINRRWLFFRFWENKSGVQFSWEICIVGYISKYANSPKINTCWHDKRITIMEYSKRFLDSPHSASQAHKILQMS